MTLRRLLAFLCLTGVLGFSLPLAGHLGFGVCVWRGERCPRSEDVPVVYGLPTAEALEQARRGRLALGGCLVGPVASLCPHCRWPARLREGRAPGDD